LKGGLAGASKNTAGGALASGRQRRRVVRQSDQGADAGRQMLTVMPAKAGIQ
jgi:hypothetical protein